MRRFGRKLVVCLVSAVGVMLAACGGGSGAIGGGNPPPNKTTPAVTVALTTNGVTTAQSFPVTVTVAGTSGLSTPTGTVTLSSGSYTSAVKTLSGGSATITVPAGSLAVGSDTLTALYAPDAASSSTYTSAPGSAKVSVTVATPTVTVTPVMSTIGTGQPLSVTVALAFSGGAVPTGSVTLSSGIYISAATPLAAGSATITIPGGTLAPGTARLTASYAPDSASSSTYASASGSATVTVTTQLTPAVTVSPALVSLATSQSLSVTVRVTGAGAMPTGSVVLSSGSYTSSATTLVSGSATIVFPAYSLVFGSDTLTAVFTPDTQSSATYTGSSQSTTVSVARVTPTVVVTPASLSINTAQSLSVTLAVTGPGTGAPAATGTIKLTSGAYASSAALSGGSATIVINAGALTAGNDDLTAMYTPDTTATSFFNSATGTSAAITVVTMSTVAVAQGTAIGTVMDRLLGMNLAVWYDNHTNASAIHTAFAQAGIKAVRWPGGSTSDLYHWQTNTACPGSYVNPNSTFSNFVSDIVTPAGLDLALTADYGSNSTCTGPGDPTEAAGWAAEALKEGITVSYMTVGNEQYGNWEYDLHTVKNDAATYAGAVAGSNGYFASIKAASPNTKVGVSVNPGNIPSWDPIVLASAKGSYDFVEYHFYPQGPNAESDSYIVLTAARDLTTNINIIKSELQSVGVKVPIYVGEIGSVFTNPGKQSWSISQGLYAGQALGEMMNAGISRLTWWIGFGNCNGNAGSMSSSLYGWQTFGAYNVFSDGPSDTACPGAGPIGTMSPTARAFQLFSNLAIMGENVLGATVNGDRTNIRAYAATHNGGTALFLFNLNENQSQPVTVTLSGQAASSGVTMITYDKSIYDQTNPAINPTPVWADPKSTDLGAQNLPLTLTLTPWSMNVVIIK